MINNTDVFISQLPIACAQEIEASAFEYFESKCGINFAEEEEKGKTKDKLLKVGWYDVREFPYGWKIFSDTWKEMEQAETIVTIEGPYKRLFGGFISSPLKRYQIEQEYRSKRFGSFPTPIMDVAIQQHLAAFGLSLIHGLIVGIFPDPIWLRNIEINDLDVFRFLGRNADRMSPKHAETIRDWILKSRKATLEDYFNWLDGYHVSTKFRDELTHEIERILQNDLL